MPILSIRLWAKCEQCQNSWGKTNRIFRSILDLFLMPGFSGLMLNGTILLLGLVWVSWLGFEWEVCTDKEWAFVLILKQRWGFWAKLKFLQPWADWCGIGLRNVSSYWNEKSLRSWNTEVRKRCLSSLFQWFLRCQIYFS